MESNRAFSAGLFGALAMSLLLFVARSAGIPANIGMLLGTLFGALPSAEAWTLGVMLHLLLGGLFALAYGWAFEHLTHSATPVVGAGVGVVHAIFAGAALGRLGSLHPAIPDLIPAPGFFMANLGFEGVALFVLLQLVYGAVVGGLYGPVRTASPLDSAGGLGTKTQFTPWIRHEP